MAQSDGARGRLGADPTLFSRVLLLQGATPLVPLHVGCPVVCLSVAGPPTPKRDFWAVQAILSNFCILEFFFQMFFFTQNIFSPPKKFFSLSLFYAFLDVSCHPECSNSVGEVGRETMPPSILVFSLCTCVIYSVWCRSKGSLETCGWNEFILQISQCCEWTTHQLHLQQSALHSSWTHHRINGRDQLGRYDTDWHIREGTDRLSSEPKNPF